MLCVVNVWTLTRGPLKILITQVNPARLSTRYGGTLEESKD